MSTRAIEVKLGTFGGTPKSVIMREGDTICDLFQQQGIDVTKVSFSVNSSIGRESYKLKDGDLIGYSKKEFKGA